MCPSNALREAEDRCIGREHFHKADYLEATLTGIPAADRRLARLRRRNPLRAHIAAVYLLEMRAAIIELWRVLAPGGHVVFVAGDNHVGGTPFRTSAFLRQMFKSIGFRTRLRLVDAIHSRGLMTKRNKTAALITREWVFLFQKPRTARRAVSERTWSRN